MGKEGFALAVDLEEHERKDPKLVHDLYKLVGAQGPPGDQGVQGAPGEQGDAGAQGPQGEQGVEGDQGDVGAQGPTGDQGSQGFQGEQGEQGTQGFQGLMGEQGPAGPQGEQGEQGATGPQGEIGPQGNVGEQGDTGAQGLQGFQGDTGAQGVQGTQGEIGSQGETGSEGAQGAQGFQGATGSTGSQGPQGNVGSQGETGSEGAQGSQGFQGDIGTQGVQGFQGLTGSQGAIGPQGNQGFQGDTGATGDEGPQGAQGDQGDVGDTGSQGATGDQGDTGVQGAVGPQGDAGAQGAVGPQGNQGFQGPDGAQGVQGSQGFIGDQGPTGSPGLDINWEGQWVTDTLYHVNDSVENNESSYICIVEHTSSATDEPGVGVNWETYWDPLALKGEQGAQGAPGPQGNQGTQGNVGEQGPSGTQGYQGVQGAEGAQGATGDQGAVGDQGDTGDTGAQGAEGAQGATGDTGSQGVQGAVGDQGAAGTQGYQGYQGAEGAQGAVGPQGDAGAQGATGSEGAQGTQGFQGATGSTGSQGPQGNVGEQGETGSTGSQGPQGFQGAEGAQGAVGSQGNIGEQGEAGPQGNQGVQGALGNQGYQGNQGFVGDQGAPGSQGNQGFQGPLGNQGTQGTQGLEGDQGVQGLPGYGPKEFAENFDGLDLGNIHDQGDYPMAGNWVNYSGAGCTAEVVVRSGADRILRFTDNGSGPVAGARVIFTSGREILSGIMEFKGKNSVTDKTAKVTLLQDTTVFLSVDFSTTGQIKIQGPDLVVHTIQAYLANTEYKIRINFDAGAGYMLVWIDGVFDDKYTVDFSNAYYADRLDIHTGAPSGYTFEVDDIVILNLTIEGYQGITGPQGNQGFQGDTGSQGPQGTPGDDDAHTLDGEHGSYYRDAGNLNAGIVPSARLSKTQAFYETDPRLPVTNEVHSTLSAPTIAELSIPSSPYVRNNLQFVVPIIHEYTLNGVDWFATSYTATQLKKWVAGRSMGANLVIPSPTVGEWEAVRFTFQAPTYNYMNWLYLYISNGGHQMNFKIEKSYGAETDNWSQVAQTGNSGGWPNHKSIPHTNIPWHSTGGTPGTHSKYIRLTIYPVYSGSYPDNSIVLYNINWYGYYPANPQTDIWYWDENGNLHIKENLNLPAGKKLYLGTNYLDNLVADNKVPDSERWKGHQLPTLVSDKYLYTADGINLSWATGGQGPQGYQGFQGSTGAQGPTGSQGPKGDQGDAGAQGASGAQGVKGDQGFTGQDGDQGDTGAQGSTGSQGFQGEEGTQGNQGFQGAAGGTGPEGEQGDQGYQGTQGVQGATGDEGDQGLRGYQGYQGNTGPQGPRGYEGYQGEDGAQGTQGFQGVDGEEGDPGPQGTQGYQGNTGAQGPRGYQGYQGNTGSQGPRGYQGYQGDPATDADTVDTLHASAFLRSNVDDNLTAAIIVPTANRDEGMFGTYESSKTQHIWSMGIGYRNSPTGAGFGNLYGLAYQYNGVAGGHGVYLVNNGAVKSGLGVNVWTSGKFISTALVGNTPMTITSTTKVVNLNVERVDNLHASSFIRSDADDYVSGHTNWQDTKEARFGDAADFRIRHDGSNSYMRSYKHGANIYLQAENAGGTNYTLLTLDPDVLGIIVRDHGAAATDMVVNVCYGTGSPPAANTTTIGTLFVKYTA